MGLQKSLRTQRFDVTAVNAEGRREMGIMNIEQGTQNNEGTFEIRYSLLDIRYSKNQNHSSIFSGSLT